MISIIESLKKDNIEVLSYRENGRDKPGYYELFENNNSKGVIHYSLLFKELIQMSKSFELSAGNIFDINGLLHDYNIKIKYNYVTNNYELINMLDGLALAYPNSDEELQDEINYYLDNPLT